MIQLKAKRCKRKCSIYYKPKQMTKFLYAATKNEMLGSKFLSFEFFSKLTIICHDVLLTQEEKKLSLYIQKPYHEVIRFNLIIDDLLSMTNRRLAADNGNVCN